MKPKRFLLKIPFFIIIFLAFIAGLGFMVSLLWNQLIPELFHGPQISFWQGTGLLLLSWILFHGFPGGRAWAGRGRRDYRGRWREKFEKMSPEEREKFRQAWQKRCGPDAMGPWSWWDRHDQGHAAAGHPADPAPPAL